MISKCQLENKMEIGGAGGEDWDKEASLAPHQPFFFTRPVNMAHAREIKRARDEQEFSDRKKAADRQNLNRSNIQKGTPCPLCNFILHTVKDIEIHEKNAAIFCHPPMPRPKKCDHTSHACDKLACDEKCPQVCHVNITNQLEFFYSENIDHVEIAKPISIVKQSLIKLPKSTFENYNFFEILNDDDPGDAPQTSSLPTKEKVQYPKAIDDTKQKSNFNNYKKHKKEIQKIKREKLKQKQISMVQRVENREKLRSNRIKTNNNKRQTKRQNNKNIHDAAIKKMEEIVIKPSRFHQRKQKIKKINKQRKLKKMEVQKSFTERQFFISERAYMKRDLRLAEELITSENYKYDEMINVELSLRSPALDILAFIRTSEIVVTEDCDHKTIYFDMDAFGNVNHFYVFDKKTGITKLLRDDIQEEERRNVRTCVPIQCPQLVVGKGKSGN